MAGALGKGVGLDVTAFVPGSAGAGVSGFEQPQKTAKRDAANENKSLRISSCILFRARESKGTRNGLLVTKEITIAMKKTPPSESGFSRLRVLFAVILCTIGASLAMISFAADPPSGSITPASSPVTWNGTGTGIPPAAGGEPDCEEGVNCDTFELTISGTPGDWTASNKQVKVRIQWLLNSSDYDLVVHKDTIDGPLVGSSGGFANTGEEVVLNPASPSIGTGVFFVRAIYFAASSADQYNGVASVVDAAPPPTVAPPAAGVAPRYQNITPPAAGPATLGIDAAEPSIGVNWTSETGQNGGRSMYIALLQTLRVTFDDTCPSSPSSSCLPITPPVARSFHNCSFPPGRLRPYPLSAMTMATLGLRVLAPGSALGSITRPLAAAVHSTRR